MREIRSKYQNKNYYYTTMTEIDCPYCKGTFLVDLGYAPIRYYPSDYETKACAEVHCPYCTERILFNI